MKTLKKSLSLILVLAMVCSLFAFGVSAEDKFTDQKSIVHQEAAQVLAGIGVLNGHQDGSYKPEDNLTRAQGVSIVVRMLGQNQAAGTAPFNDCDEAINASHGFAIQYAAENGIVAGYGDGRFGPMDPLTGVQFEKMLLTALGYDAQIEGFLGSEWEINVAKFCRNINLDEDLEGFDVNAAITRDEAAQLAFNALKSNVVYYSTTLDTSLSGESDSIRTNIRATPVSDIDTVNGNSSKNYKSLMVDGNGLQTDPTPYTQMCEKYFDRLKLKEDEFDNSGHMANKWTYKGEEISFISKTPAHTIVAGNTKNYEVVINDYRKSLKVANAYNNNKVYKNGVAGDVDLYNDAAVVGDVIEIYTNKNDIDEVTGVVITQYQAHKVTGDVQTRVSGGKDQVRIPGVVNSWTDLDKVYGSTSVAKDDIAYFYEGASGEFHVYKAESFEGTLTGYKTWDGNDPQKYIIDGKEYSINGSASSTLLEGLNSRGTKEATAENYFVPTNYNDLYEYYLDGNGFIVYTKLVESSNKDYVMIQRLNWNTNAGLANNDAAEARLVFMDGTTKVVKIDNIENCKPVQAGLTIAQVAADKNLRNVTSYREANLLQDGVYASDNEINNVTDTVRAGYFYYIGGNYYFGVSGDNVNQNLEKTMLFTYTVNSNGDYSLRAAGRSSNVETGANTFSPIVDTKVQPRTGRLFSDYSDVTVNDNTVFIVVNRNDANKYSMYVGKNNCPEFTVAANTQLIYTYATEKDVATYVVVNQYTSQTGGTYIFMLDDHFDHTTEIKHDDGSTTRYYVYKAYVEGATEVQEVYLTDDANDYVDIQEYNGNGIGMYTSPEFDDYGNISGFAGNYDEAYERNGEVFLGSGFVGYKKAGTVLMVGRQSLDRDTFATSFDCPNNAIFILDDDGISIGTAADMGDDINDKVYVGLTNNTDDNRVEVVYVKAKGPDENGFTLYKGAKDFSGAEKVTTTLTHTYVDQASGRQTDISSYNITKTDADNLYYYLDLNAYCDVVPVAGNVANVNDFQYAPGGVLALDLSGLAVGQEVVFQIIPESGVKDASYFHVTITN